MYAYYERGNTAALRRLGMEKQAALPILAAIAGLTGALHTGANAAFKGLRSLHHLPAALGDLPVGHNYETQSLAMGIDAARRGERMNPGLKTTLATGLGPESIVMNTMGEALGKPLQGKSRHEVRRYLKQLRKGVALAPSIQDTPLGAPVVGAVNHLLEEQPTALERTFRSVGLGPTDASKGKTLGQTLAPAAAGLAAIGIDPHAALHFGINGTRQMVAESDYGKRLMSENFRKGLDGVQMSKLVQKLWDFGVSPAVLDTFRTGQGVRQAIQHQEPGVRRLSGILGSLGGSPEATALMEKLQAGLLANPQMAAQLAATPGVQNALNNPALQARLAANPAVQAQMAANPGMQGQLQGLWANQGQQAQLATQAATLLGKAPVPQPRPRR